MGPTHVGHLQRLISAKRYSQYAAVFGGDQRAGATLYVLDVEARGALLELLHSVELPLRDAIHRSLSQVYRKRWFDRADMLDGRTVASFKKAQRELGRLLAREPDRVVAQVSLGAWTGLLEPGGQIRNEAGEFVTNADYERDLWIPSLRDTFRGLAATRSDAEALLRRVRRARNRVAHHESVVFGVHQIGERSAEDKLVRQAPMSVLKDIRDLLEHFGPDLRGWLTECRHVEEIFTDDYATAALEYAKLKRDAHWI